jgi:trafficking protein particle complex subunit 8
VTTRTTALTSVSHSSFALRFSNLEEIESACKEPEEQRAARTIDWINARVTHRCSRWIHDLESQPPKEDVRTPWWDEIKRCTEGDHVPSRFEMWNHPVAGD